MKKIAIVFSGDSRALNGAALYVNRFRTIEKELKESGIQPIICDNNNISNKATSDEEAVAIEKEYANGSVHAMKNRIKSMFEHSYIGNLLYLHYAFYKPGRESVSKNAQKLENADSLLVNDLPSAYYCMKSISKKPMFFIMHNSGQLLSMLESRLPFIKGQRAGKKLEGIAEDIFRHSKRIIFVSQKALELFCNEHPQYADKTVYIPVGIVDAVYKNERSTSPISFVCVGTVCTRKNQLSIVRAMKDVPKEKANLTIVGGGEKLQECIQYAKDNDLDNISFPGSVESILDYLNNASVFIMASLDEGLPAVGVEALRAGLPVMTTNVGGCSELVQGNGLLIEGTDSDSIARAMNRMIAEAEEIQEMGKKSRNLYEDNYSIEAMVSAYKKILVDGEYGE